MRTFFSPRVKKISLQVVFVRKRKWSVKGVELGEFKNPTNNGGVMTFSYEKIRKNPEKSGEGDIWRKFFSERTACMSKCAATKFLKEILKY